MDMRNNQIYLKMKMAVNDEEIDMEIDDKIEKTGGTGSTSDYEELDNLPRINGVKLIGNKTAKDLKVQPEGDYLTNENFEKENVDIDFSKYFVKE